MLATMMNTNEASHDDSGWTELCSLVDTAMKAGEFEARAEAMRAIAQRNIGLAQRAIMPGGTQTVAEHYGFKPTAEQRTAAASVDALMAAVERLAGQSKGL
jgi:hypothetical protein